MLDTIEITTDDAAAIVEFIEDLDETDVPENVKQAQLRIWLAYCDKYI